MLIGVALTFVPIRYAMDALFDLQLGAAVLWFIVAFVVLSAAFLLAVASGGSGDDLASAWERQWYCRTCGSKFLVPAREQIPVEQLRVVGRTFVSPVATSGRRSSRADYARRVLDPVQRAASMTDRDRAGLQFIAEHARADASFDPEGIGCDLGVVSRLSSLNLIGYDQSDDRFFVELLARKVAPEALARVGWWQKNFG